MEAGPENCIGNANSYVTSVRVRCISDQRVDTETAPMELELSGSQHTQTCLPDLPTAVTL